MIIKNGFDLIITIINKGNCHNIVKASKKAGAGGGTVIPGRGSGIHDTKTIFGIPIEPEKDIILTAVPREKTEVILEAIIKAGNLDEPATGVAFVMPLSMVAGINHLAGACMDKD